MSRLHHLGKAMTSGHIGKMTDRDKKSGSNRRRKTAQSAALAEAKARRAAHKPEKRQSESGGQDGPEPTRYGDWEKDGIISDF